MGWDVHALIRRESSVSALARMANKIELHVMDGHRNGGDLYDIIGAANPQIVFHLASLFQAEHKRGDIPLLIESNIAFGAKLVDAMLENGVRNFINTGTSWQHYNGDAYNPVSLYAATKQAFEAIIAFYVESSHLKVITLKLSDTYGPGDRRRKLFTLLRDSAERQDSILMSPGEQFVDLVYIDDVVQAYVVAAERLLNTTDCREEYSVSSTELYKLREVVEMYADIAQVNLQVQWGGRAYRKREVMVPWRTGRWLPGWQPIVSLADGIRRMEADHSENAMNSKDNS